VTVEYLRRGGRLPKGRPDRVRLCIWYADYLDRGLEHTEALESARGCLRLLHMGMAGSVGPLAGGIPVQLIGESDEVPAIGGAL
jgi:hypothetical protein